MAKAGTSWGGYILHRSADAWSSRIQLRQPACGREWKVRGQGTDRSTPLRRPVLGISGPDVVLRAAQGARSWWPVRQWRHAQE